VESQLTSEVRWQETQAIDPIQIIEIYNLIQFATKAARGSLKQRKLTNFLKK